MIVKSPRAILAIAALAVGALFLLAGVAVAQEYHCTVTGTDGDATLFRCVEVTPMPTVEPTPESTATPTATAVISPAKFYIVEGIDGTEPGTELLDKTTIYPFEGSIRVEGLDAPVVITVAGPDLNHNQTENLAPYMVFGDAGGTLNLEHRWYFGPGVYTVTAGDTTISFFVQEPEPVSTPTPTPTEEPPAPGAINPFGNWVVSDNGPAPGKSYCDVHPDGPHGMWNAVDECWYNHTHNAAGNYRPSPDFVLESDLDGVFGDWGAEWGGTFSYPWNSSPMENTAKHPGFKILAKKNLIPNFADYTYIDSRAGITDFRATVHGIGAGVGLTTRIHSFWQEVRACYDPNDESTCGIAKTGGWNDYGSVEEGDGLPIMHYPYKQFLRTTPVDGGSIHAEPYIGMRTMEQALDRFDRNSTCCQGSIWSSKNESSRFGYNLRGGQVFSIYDDWGTVWPGGIDQVNRSKTDIHLLCANRDSEGQCVDDLYTQNQWNSTLWNMREIAFYRANSLATEAPQWFTEQGGYVTGQGWTNERGELNFSCSETGPGCIPLVVENFPAVFVAYTGTTGNGHSESVEYDFSIPETGDGWKVQYPN